MITIDHFVTAVTSAEAALWHVSPHQCTGPSGKITGETVMIDALPLAFIVLAVGVPVLIGATILGSRV